KARVLTEQVRLALAEGRPADAEPQLRAALQLMPYEIDAQFALSRCLDQLRRPDEAAAARQRWKALDADQKELNDLIREMALKKPRDPDLRHRAGVLCVNLGRDEDAMRWFASALQIAPTHAPSKNELQKLRARGKTVPSP